MKTKNLIVGLALLSLILGGFASASAGGLTLANFNNVTVVTGLFDNASTYFTGASAIWEVPSEGITDLATSQMEVIIDRANATLDFYPFNVTYNISAPDSYNITHISIEFLGKEMNTALTATTAYWNTTNQTGNPDSVADTDGDGYYEANFSTTLTPGEVTWRAGDVSSNFTIEQEVGVVIGVTKNHVIERTVGEVSPVTRVIGLGASSEDNVLVNYTFNISTGSQYVNMTNLNFTVYVPFDPINGTLQLFWHNNSETNVWLNATANVSQSGQKIYHFNVSKIGMGGTTVNSMIHAINDTVDFRMQYASSSAAPYMSANTSKIAGRDDSNPDLSGYQQEFTVSLNETGGVASPHNVTLRYNLNDELYDSDFQLQTWITNTSKWADITPTAECGIATTLNDIFGETWSSCYYDEDGDSKPEAFNVTIPSMSERKFLITAAVIPGKMITYAPGGLQTCGDGICGTDETFIQCPRDCGINNPDIQQEAIGIVKRETPSIGISHLIVGLIVIMGLLALMNRK